MPKEVIMPALGMAQETGTLLRWLKREGDAVEKGEPLMEIATDKVDVEIEAPASGVLTNVTAAEGEEIPVGRAIALILAPGEDLTPSPPSRLGEGSGVRASASPVAARMAAEYNIDLAQITPVGGRIQKEDVLAFLAQQENSTQSRTDRARVLASPKARRLAQEAGIDLASLAGSGPEGAILAADVTAARKAEETADGRPQTAEEVPMSRLWQVMAERLTQSWTTVPHFYLSREVDAGQLIAWRKQLQSRGGGNVTFTDLLVKLTAVALKRHPRLNASWQNGRIIANAAINIGLAVAVEDGLLVPVIHHSDQLGLFDLAAHRADLVGRTQNGKLSTADLQGGTFTISNLGMYGVDHFNAIVNPPQAAILAVGRIADRVVPVDGQPGVRPMLTLTLSCDHRVVDGARGAQFLSTLAELIENPLRTLD
ncbi:MAG: 2-oxo acid dehydrogenase subunit E2 [Caldilineaceae bacterium]|nr:2-oxo acid dehydrogenase subunit E2 [Caldilineaceae bacterium]